MNCAVCPRPIDAAHETAIENADGELIHVDCAPTYPECHWCAGTYRPISETGSEAVGEPICEACAATLDNDAFDPEPRYWQEPADEAERRAQDAEDYSEWERP